MKLKLKISLLMMVSVALIYSACKKAATDTTDPVLTPDVVTSQVAVNISQSLFGGSGAIDLSGGLNAPKAFAVHTQGKVLQSLSNPFCGLVIDTTVNYTLTQHDTTVTVAGHINFGFTCNNEVLTGYTTNDNLSIALSTSQFAFADKVAESLTLLSLNPSDPNANLSLKGTLSANDSYQLKTGTKRSGTRIFNYTLTSLIINPSAGDVVSGSATFTTSGTGPKGVWSFQGTITFLGNHKATVTISGKSYTVNLETGIIG